jgi:transcriptional regulator with XRE-family HTH domain
VPTDSGNETVGRRLRRLRTERGFSQRELSSPGVSYAYISRIEAGARRPSVKALRMLARKLQVSPEYLETGSDLREVNFRELRLTEAELRVRLGDDWETAQDSPGEVLEEAIAAGDRDAAVRARLTLGLSAARKGKDHEAIGYLETAFEAERPLAKARPDIYATLGRSYANVGAADRAVELFEECLQELGEDPDDLAMEVRYSTYLSYALTDAGDYDRAERLLNELAERLLEAADPYTRVRLYWSLGRLATREGRASTGLDHFRRAVALLEATEDTLHLAQAHVSCAWALTKGSRAEEAGRHLELAERLFGPHIESADLGWLRTEQAKRAAKLGRGEEAVERAEEAIGALGESDAGERGEAWCAKAEGYALLDGVDEADKAFRIAVDLLRGHRPSRDAVAVCRSWSTLLRKAGRESDALDVLELSAALAADAADLLARGAKSARLVGLAQPPKRET